MEITARGAGGSVALVVAGVLAWTLIFAYSSFTIADGNAAAETNYSNVDGTITLSNSLIELRWDSSNGTLTSLKNQKTSEEHLGGPLAGNWSAFIDLGTEDQWEAWLGTMFRGREHALTDVQAHQLDDGMTVELVFDNVGGRNITIKQRVTVHDGDPVSRWTTEAINNEPDSTVTALVSPQLTGIQELAGEHLLWPYKEGEIFDGPGTFFRIMQYPVPASMQWMNLYNNEGGLYYAVLDDTARHKEFRFGHDQFLDPHGSLPRQMSVTHWPYTENGASFSSPVVEIGVHSGGEWYWGADRYRDWLINDAGWARDLSPKAEALDSWLTGFNKFYDEPLKMSYSGIPDYLEARDSYGIRTLEMLGWHFDGFDSYYPDYEFLDDAGGPGALADAIEEVHDNDKDILFYLNNHIADWGSDWYAANADMVEIQDHNGNYYYEEYGNNRDFWAISPHSSPWIDQLRDRAMALRDMGADGIWWDQQGEMDSVVDYNKNAGHSSPSYSFAEGYTKMMNEIHEAFSYNGTDTDYVFAMEGVNDFHSQFIDINGMMWMRRLGHVPHHAPQVTRYTIPSRFLGLPTAGIPTDREDAYAWAFTMGNPLLVDSPQGHEVPNPHVFPRYLDIYNAEPTIYLTGQYKDERGLTIASDPDEAVKGTTIVAERGDRLGIQLRNTSDSAKTVMVTLAYDEIGLSGKAVRSVTDVETRRPVRHARETDTVTFSVTVPARDVAAYKVSFRPSPSMRPRGRPQ